MTEPKEIVEYVGKELSGISALAAEIAEEKTKRMRTQTAEEYREDQKLLAEVRVLPITVAYQKEEMEGVPCEWAYSLSRFKEKRVIIYLHGGSWMFGNMDSARPVSVMLAKETRCKVLTVDYRRAPEHPYPAGFEDCYKVYLRLLQKGYVPEEIGLFGDSAGGNYSLALINRLKAEGQPLPACVACASPVTDMRTTSAIVSSNSDLIYTRHNGQEETIFSVYLGEKYNNQRDLPSISPIMGDLSGLPPVLIHVGGGEPIAEDNIAYAEKMAAAGGRVLVKVWKDMFHDFSIVGHTLRESRQSMAEIGNYFRGLLSGS